MEMIITGPTGQPMTVDVTPEHAAVIVRADRDRRMAAMSWRYDRHAREVRLGLAPTDDLTALDAYMQALADLPTQEGFPFRIDWPRLD